MSNQEENKKPSLFQRIFGSVETTEEESKDFLDEIIEERTAKNPEFPKMMGMVQQELEDGKLGYWMYGLRKPIDHTPKEERPSFKVAPRDPAKRLTNEELEQMLIEIREKSKREEAVEAAKNPEQVLVEKAAREAKFKRLADQVAIIQAQNNADENDNSVKLQKVKIDYELDQYGLDEKRSPETIQAMNKFNKTSIQNLINLLQKALDCSDFEQVKEIAMTTNKFVVEQIFEEHLLGKITDENVHLLPPIVTIKDVEYVPALEAHFTTKTKSWFGDQDIAELRAAINALDKALAPKIEVKKPKTKKSNKSKPKAKKAAKKKASAKKTVRK